MSNPPPQTHPPCPPLHAPSRYPPPGYVTEVHKFSKFIHGTATLLPEAVQAVPYWIDDESIRASMLASTALPSGTPRVGPTGASPRAGPSGAGPSDAALNGKPRTEVEELRHPLLGAAPTLQLIGQEAREREAGGRGGPWVPRWLRMVLGIEQGPKPRKMPMR